jgi:hypothetical protein
MKKLLLPVTLTLAILVLINLILLLSRDPYTKTRLSMLSPSAGDRYVAHLTLWRLLIDNRQWTLADQEEQYLNPADIVAYKALYHPDEFKKQLNNLAVKPVKTVADYLEMAGLQHRLGKDTDAQNSLLSAKNLDPVRDDLNTLFLDSQVK